MARGFKLHTRKHYARREAFNSLHVSIPLNILKRVPSAIVLDDNLVPFQPKLTFLQFKSSLAECLPRNWLDVSPQTEASIATVVVCKPVCPVGSMVPTVAYSISIAQDYTWNVSVYGRLISHTTNPVIQNSPETISNPQDVLSIISILENAKFCMGYPEKKYQQLVQHRNGNFYDGSGICLFLLLQFFITTFLCRGQPSRS